MAALTEEQPPDVIPRDFGALSSYYVRVQRERRCFPEFCDVILYSTEGVAFRAHKKVLSEGSDFFRSMFLSDFVEGRTNECRLQAVDERTLAIVLDYLYRQEPTIPDDLILPVFAASQFFSLPWLHAYCAVNIARRPFETALEQPLFLHCAKVNPTIINLLLDLDLLLMDKIRLKKVIKSWPTNDHLSDAAKRLQEKSNLPREMAIILDRSIINVVVFTGNRITLRPLPFRFSSKSQHIATFSHEIYYATDSYVGAIRKAAPLYIEDKVDLVWPPLLRQCGSTAMAWTTNNRRLLRVRQSKSNSNISTESFAMENNSIVRHIASTDSRVCKNVTVVVTTNNLWKVLQQKLVDGIMNFVDIDCPFKYIECATILHDNLYVIGGPTASSVPRAMLRYDQQRQSWIELSNRKRNLIPRAFMSLNGRLYVFVAGLSTVEVYEPSIDTWILDDMHKLIDIGGFSIVSEEFYMRLR